MKYDMSGDGLMRKESSRYGYAIVKLCHGVAQEKNFYAYIAIEPQNLDYFYQHYIPRAQAHVEPFGEELMRGWGEAPDASVAEYFRQKHNVHFCRDERSILALTEKVRSDLARGGQNITASTSNENAEESFLEFCKDTLEKPLQTSGH